MTEEFARKKILLVTRPIAPPWDEASKNFAFTLANNIPEDDFYLLTNGFLPELPPHIHQKAIYTSNKLTYLQRIRLLKLRHILHEKFDIIHYMLTPTRLNTFSFKKVVKNKSARTIQTVATLREDLFKDKELKNILFADLIITYSDRAKEKLNSIGQNNVKRIYPGINLDIYKPTGKDPEFMTGNQLSEKDFVILYEGEFSRLGFIDNLVKLVVTHAEELKKRNIKILFPGRIKGKEDEEKKKEVKKIITEKNCLDIIRFTDEFEKEYKLPPDKEELFMQKKYNICDLTLFPVHDMKGKFDVPLAVVESMACQKPVIISDLPILREFANGNNSVIIEKGNVDALAKAIFDLYDNPAKREEIGRNARKFVEENFDIKKIAEIYRKIYEVL